MAYFEKDALCRALDNSFGVNNSTAESIQKQDGKLSIFYVKSSKPIVTTNPILEHYKGGR